MLKRRIGAAELHHACFFRSSVSPPHRKALIQITERCNLRCVHCFVSARQHGREMSLNEIKKSVLPSLVSANVKSITLTGGEPMIHPDICEIVRSAVQDFNFPVTICSNGEGIDLERLSFFRSLERVYFNISLDGFSDTSHGRFRGSRTSFSVAKEAIKKLASHQILKGILVTPNKLGTLDEYKAMCRFAAEQGAEYVLMNPLYSFGRGVHSAVALRADDNFMLALSEEMDRTRGIEMVKIRFPNSDSKNLTGCDAGRIIYVYTAGDVAVCPYLTFAATTPNSKYDRSDFIVGNLLTGSEILEPLEKFDVDSLFGGANSDCAPCSRVENCGRGCPAVVVASGGYLGEVDSEMCPKIANRPPSTMICE
jgi:radical SAM protein with 4Fe4S-binding SPASM domain|nr:radical SAM protein [Neorhizobium tomejilense]